ncbi:unnamed protein product [Prunus armeniaca]
MVILYSEEGLLGVSGDGAPLGLTTLDLLGKIHTVDADEVVSWVLQCQHDSDVAMLQNKDGSFNGDIWGEVDTRFSYIAICCLSLLHRLDKINVEKAVNYIDTENGGISNRPDDAVDVYHSYFGVAGK